MLSALHWLSVCCSFQAPPPTLSIASIMAAIGITESTADAEGSGPLTSEDIGPVSSKAYRQRGMAGVTEVTATAADSLGTSGAAVQHSAGPIKAVLTADIVTGCTVIAIAEAVSASDCSRIIYSYTEMPGLAPGFFCGSLQYASVSGIK